MVHAILMVDTAAGTAEQVAGELRIVDGVSEAHVVAGDFDVAVEVEGEDVRDLLQTVTERVRTLDGVGTTRCYVCIGH